MYRKSRRERRLEVLHSVWWILAGVVPGELAVSSGGLVKPGWSIGMRQRYETKGMVRYALSLSNMSQTCLTNNKQGRWLAVSVQVVPGDKFLMK